MEDSGLQLREYLHIFRRRKWIMFGTGLTVVVSAFLASLRMTPVYESTTRMEIQPITSATSDEGQLLESLANPGRSLATQVELIKSDAVLERAKKELGLRSTRPLKGRVDVELIPDTEIVEIRVEHQQPDQASRWASAVAAAYIDFRRDRALDAVVAAGEEIGRRIEELKGQIAESDRILGDLKGAADSVRAKRDTEAAELARLQAQASAPAPPSPAPAPNRSGLLSRIEQSRLRISELDRQIADYDGGGAGPKSDRDTLVARMGALEAQRQALPDAKQLQRGGGTIIVPATTPMVPVRPNIPRNVALATALGIALAVGVAFLAEQLDDRIRSPEEIERRTGAPILGYIPYVSGWTKADKPMLALIDDPLSGAAEAFRTLRTNLRFLALEHPIRTVLVTSALGEEGKSTTSANLAVAFAEGGTQTLLVSGDLRRPHAHRLLNLSDEVGLLQALDPDYPLGAAVQTNGVANFALLATGGHPPNPTEILASPRLGELLRALQQESDLLVIDSPPVLGLADASVLASRVDGVLMVVDAQQVTGRVLAHAVEQIKKAGGRVLGTVVNSVEPREGYGYYYQYYYYRYAQDGQTKKGERDGQTSAEITAPEGSGTLSIEEDDDL